jgi:hypothetical protein
MAVMRVWAFEQAVGAWIISASSENVRYVALVDRCGKGLNGRSATYRKREAAAEISN